MLYPFGGCETQPLIDMNNITLRNVSSTAGWLPPGVIRCNETNPCHGFVFEDVNIEGWFNIFGLDYITENVYGIQKNAYPEPGFVAEGEEL